MEDKISLKEIKDSIINSGYLIEQRVEPVIEKEGYYVETNEVYFDPDTNKSKEIDLTAISGIKISKDNFLFPFLLVECENNKQPVVFFKSNSSIDFLAVYDIKISGHPTYLYESDGSSISIADKLNFSKFHHYCNSVHCTQYCSFHQTKKGNLKKWIALHPDEQHNTFLGLIKCLNAKIDEHLNSYKLPEKDEKECINLQLYYPILILQGDLYEAELVGDELKLTQSNHIVFKKQFASNKGNETYYIDVISERYLPDYLKLIDSGIKKINDRIRRKKSMFYDTLDILVSELKKAKNPKEFRKILEF
ncbi:MAG: hypothetical protein KAT66_01605 [Candidatus Lokiarchaeota archaeon]|jgi:hypothetical protein|nr:hypothetical protein [Candidatus Lokiarchaeota archaeon]